MEVAEGGTLFIDEVAEMSPGLQAKLLRVLENGHYRRVGSTTETHADVRVVAATNKPLENEIKAGHFREDLFYRLNVMTIDLPPLRERREDDLTPEEKQRMDICWSVVVGLSIIDPIRGADFPIGDNTGIR